MEIIGNSRRSCHSWFLARASSLLQIGFREMDGWGEGCGYGYGFQGKDCEREEGTGRGMG